MGELESQEAVTGEVPLLPIQKMFFDNNYEDYNQFNQSVLLKLKKEIFLSHLERVLQRITDVYKRQFLDLPAQGNLPFLIWLVD